MRLPMFAGMVGVGLLLSVPSPKVHAWGTPEHIRFGNRIATPFEERIVGTDLPVLRADNGPHTFGQWVSAPDFGRSLSRFLFPQPPVDGYLPCSVLWAEEGANVDGTDIDDQTLAEADESSVQDPLVKRAIGDCALGWRVNNNHFGDFAARAYIYYHGQAIEAARRYRRTRQPACRSAAYTLEGWGQHYLTDSTAAGHAWNPAGTYDDTAIGSFIGSTGPGIRMRIHNYLNENGAKMAGALYDDGTFWGDHSEKYNDNRSIPEMDDWNAQYAVTTRLARMGLGQVVAAAECGGQTAHTSGDFFSPTDDNEPRRVYDSNWSMCNAMYGHEFGKAWIPQWVDHMGLTNENTMRVMDACDDKGGNLAGDSDAPGADLAANYMQDKYDWDDYIGFNWDYYFGWEREDCDPSDPECATRTLDPESVVSLDDYGCYEDMDVAAMPAAKDTCWNALCEQPAGADNRCPSGMAWSEGCCYGGVSYGGSGDAQMLPWVKVTTAETQELGSTGAVRGEDQEFLWFADDTQAPSRSGAAATWGRIDGATASLGDNGPRIEQCGKEGTFQVYETKVKMPRTQALADKVVTLYVQDMDDGLKVQVNGHLVGYIEKPGSLPLITAVGKPDADGNYVVRLTSLNDCAEQKMVMASLSIDTKSDELGFAPEPSAGCSATPGARIGYGAASALLFGLALLIRRRSRSR